MSFARWSSLLVMLTVAAAVVGVFYFLDHVDWKGSTDWVAPAIAIASTAAAVGAIHAALMSRLLSELRRLKTHVESFQSGSSKASAFRAKLGLIELSEAIDTSVGSLRRRADELISQRRELEVQLRVSDGERRHAEAILNSINDAVLVTDSFNEIAVANEAAGRLLGFDLKDALRRPVDHVVNDPILVKLIKDTREGADSALRRHMEHRLPGKRSEAIYDVSLACITEQAELSHSSEAAGVVTILRDITHEKEISEMKSDFVSSVSHELRTPLSSIKAYVEMLVDGEANDEETRTEFYNIIQGETNRLQRLIDNILNISRIESGVVKVQREHVSLPTVIREVLDVMQPQARAKKIELQEVPTPLFFQVFADKDMVYQATLNLVGNAIKYTPDGGKVAISISVDEHERMVRVSVKDTGVGIPAEDLPHLFDKFYRVQSHKKMAKGTGLGLNLVKQIVETVHGGKVSVTSEYGQGSTFTYSLPMADNVY